MYQFLLGRVATPPIAKIICHLSDSPVKPGIADTAADGVQTCEIAFDVNLYPKWKSEERMQYLLDAVQSMMMLLAEKHRWDTAEFKRVEKDIINCHFQFTGKLGAWVKNSLGTSKARLEWSFYDRIRLCVSIKGAQETCLELTDLPPTLGAFNDLGKITWTNETCLIVGIKNSLNYWLVDISSNAVQFFHAKAYAGDAQGQYQLGLMYMNGNLIKRSDEAARYWLNKASDQGHSKAKELLENYEKTSKKGVSQ